MKVIPQGGGSDIKNFPLCVLTLYLPGTTFNELADIGFCLPGMLDSISKSFER